MDVPCQLCCPRLPQRIHALLLPSHAQQAARDELVALCVALQAHQLPATPVALSSLALLHSYLLVKTLVRLGDHAGAARLLLHCAEQVSAFPRHTVPILTSTVIECHRAGLHLAAQRWAAVLVRPEHAGQVGEAYRRKVEALAKRPDRCAAWEGWVAVAAPWCACLAEPAWHTRTPRRLAWTGGFLADHPHLSCTVPGMAAVPPPASVGGELPVVACPHAISPPPAPCRCAMQGRGGPP